MTRVHSGSQEAVIPAVDDGQVAAPHKHRLGDILGMALRGEITADEAQAMANLREEGDRLPEVMRDGKAVRS